MAPPRFYPTRLLSDQNFGMCITPQDFIIPFFNINSPNYYRPWKWCVQSSKDFGSTVENSKQDFKISLDVQHFRPDEISVKVTDKEIKIEGKHDERQDDHGFISRHFMRRYALPADCPSENVTSTLSSDGVLTVIAERELTHSEKVIPIKVTAPHTKEQKDYKSVTGITQKEIADTIKEAEELINKNRSQIMLKEDHSPILKPELFKDSSPFIKVEENKDLLDINKISEKLCNIPVACSSSQLDEKIESSNISSLKGLSEFGHSSLSASSKISTYQSVSEKLSEESSSSRKSSMSSDLKAAREYISDVVNELKEAAENL